MITLIHGDDTVLARKALLELKDKYSDSELITFLGSEVEITNIISSSDSLSLFSQGKVIILENLVSQAKPKVKDEILLYLNKSADIPVILYEEKEVEKITLVKYFSKAKIINCKLPQQLFKFLDSIKSSPIAEVLKTFHFIIRERQGEFVLSMLIRQWRNLLIAKDLGLSGFTNIPAWQANKFIRQAEFFSQNELIFSYRQLLSTDLKVKTGQSSYTLNQLLDIFLVSLYYENVPK